MNERYSSPNTLTTKKLLVTAIAVGATALGITAAQSHESVSPDCWGNQSLTVKPGDTLGELLVDNTKGVNGTNVRNIAIELSHQNEFRSDGPLSDFTVSNYEVGTAQPGISAGEVLNLPIECSK